MNMRCQRGFEVKAPGSSRQFRRPGTSRFCSGALARHLHESAQGQQADLVVRIAVFEAEQARSKAKGERLDAYPAELGHDEMAKLVDHDHDADKDDEGGGRNQKLVHRCTVNSFGNARPASGLRIHMKSLREHRPGPFPRFPVRSKHFRDGPGMRLRGRCEHLFNCTRDAGKRNTSFEERLDRDFVGRIQGNAVRSPFFRSLKGQAQAREAVEIGRLEVQMPQRGQVEGEVDAGRSGYARA